MVGRVNSSAFDAVADRYDAEFTATPLGRLLRERVWSLLARHVQPGDHLLELACGAGDDAIWLARRGVSVTAIDGSFGMVSVARRKISETGLDGRASVEQLALQDMLAGEWALSSPSFDAVFSNFGGLNTIDDWHPLARALASVIRPGGRVILVVMGPFCPWEVGWHLFHGEWRRAARRWNGRSQAAVGGEPIPVWYPSPRRLQRAFAPWFRHRETHSLGLWLPPSYLGHVVARFPILFAGLNRLEAATGRWTAGWGDHYMLVLER